MRVGDDCDITEVAEDAKETGDRLLTTREAAAFCEVSEDRMRDLAGDGRVPADFAHHKWFFSQRELLRLLRESPQVIYQRRTRQIGETTVTQRERARATMLRINAMRTKAERQEVGRRGYQALRGKFARQVDPNNILDEAEREQRVSMLVKAYMADIRAQQHGVRSLTTRQQRIAALPATTTAGVERAENAICFDCWRREWRTRPPKGLVNRPCAEHEALLAEYARQVRAS